VIPLKLYFKTKKEEKKKERWTESNKCTCQQGWLIAQDCGNWQTQAGLLD